jgi:hypothetical protein
LVPFKLNRGVLSINGSMRATKHTARSKPEVRPR